MTAFLYGTLEEEIYMEVPEGLNVKSKNLVCKLNKAIYGLISVKIFLKITRWAELVLKHP